MISFCGSREVVARCVADIVMALRPDSLSITITTRGTSEDCYVRIVTDTSLVDTVKVKVLNYSEQLMNISFPSTPVG